MPVIPFRQFKSGTEGFSHPTKVGQQRARTSAASGLSIRPRTAIVVAGLLAATTLGSIGSFTYWLMQSDMLDDARTEQAALETAYQDRIERLRAEIDRLNSRQILDRKSVEQQVSDLLSKQQALNERHAIVTGLMERAERSGIRLAVSNQLPSRKPDVLTSMNKDVVEDDASAIGGESEPLEDPLKALGLRGTSSAAGSAPAPQAPTPGEQAALHKVQSDLTAMTSQSTTALDALAVAAESQIDTILAATRPLGVNLSRVAKRGNARASIGGPYVPYFGSGFDGRVKRAEHALSALDDLKRAAKRLPISRPMKSVKVSSHFGPRIDPFLGKIAMHTGMDFKAPYGTRVYSSAPGTVVHAGRKGGYGKLVEIRHANGLVSRYAHLSRLQVSEGDHVTAGDVIGNVGSTGRSTGPHLHYEIRIGKEALDPSEFVAAGARLTDLIGS
ncbi:peptidoglycan DD-metalloendopeptidase family protein [Roseibium sp.]|uniref:peptidoglycan DD-metalloendopeptidase family protein n=1 Tax=Roseibium sp. TaxID=1936156 RepID=UPI003A9786CD